MTRSSIGQVDRSLLVLTSLAAGPKHGYALMQDIESFSGERLRAGTLYGCIDKLIEKGLIEALPPESRRRPYPRTGSGRQALLGALENSRNVTDVGLTRLGGVFS